jgi:hypothetical protein
MRFLFLPSVLSTSCHEIQLYEIFTLISALLQNVVHLFLLLPGLKFGYYPVQDSKCTFRQHHRHHRHRNLESVLAENINTTTDF